MKTTRHIIVTLSAILSFSAVQIRAEQEGAFTFSTANAAVSITKYTGTDSAVAIPTTINNLPVRGIGANAFLGNSGLTSVTIPEGVTSVGEIAFGDCPKLNKVTIPASLTTIGNFAFRGCQQLLSIDVAPKNPNYRSIDGVLFDKAQTTLLKYPAGKKGSYIIPDSVKSIGRAFTFCDGLNSVSLGKGITAIENRAFVGCANLANVTISETVTTIGDHAFLQCKKLDNVTIPSSVVSIGFAAFAECPGLKSLTFKGNAPKLGESAFAGVAPDFGIRYAKGSTGFTSPTWNGYPAAKAE